MGSSSAGGLGIDQLTEMGQGRAALPVTIWSMSAVGLVVAQSRLAWSISLFEATTRSAPHSARAWTNLANAYREAGRADDARGAYDRALQAMAGDPSQRVATRNPGKQRYPALVANIEQQRGRFAEAEAPLSRRARARSVGLPRPSRSWPDLGCAGSFAGWPRTCLCW